MAAVGMGDGGEDELQVFAIEPGEVTAEVDGWSAEERRGESETSFKEPLPSLCDVE